MNQIGRKIYFDKNTGEKIQDTGERTGLVTFTTIEQDIATFTALSERNRNTFGVLELPFGAYAQDFAECNGYRVNVEKLASLTEENRHEALEFSYPVQGDVVSEPVFQKPLSEQVKELQLENESLNLAVIDLYEIVLGGM